LCASVSFDNAGRCGRQRSATRRARLHRASSHGRMPMSACGCSPTPQRLVAYSTNISRRRDALREGHLCTCARRHVCQRTDGMCRRTTGPHPSPGNVRTCMHLRDTCMQHRQASTWAIASTGMTLHGCHRGIWTASLLTLPPALLGWSTRPRSRAHGTRRSAHTLTVKCRRRPAIWPLGIVLVPGTVLVPGIGVRLPQASGSEEAEAAQEQGPRVVRFLRAHLLAAHGLTKLRVGPRVAFVEGCWSSRSHPCPTLSASCVVNLTRPQHLHGRPRHCRQDSRQAWGGRYGVTRSPKGGCQFYWDLGCLIVSKKGRDGCFSARV